MKKNRLLITIALFIYLCALWMGNALGAGKRSYQRGPAKVARNSQARKIPNRSTDAIVYRQLAKTVDLSAFTLQTPFSQAIEILRNSTVPPLNIVVLWRDLSENALVERDTPIYMEGISAIPLRTGLELLLRAVSSRPNELGYVVDGGVIIIATRPSLPIKMVTRVYDITDLVAPPANYRFGMPVGPFGPAVGGFGGGWMGQMPVGGFGGGWMGGQSPIGGFGGGWGAYGSSAGRYTRGQAMQYGPGWPSQRANQVADFITGTIAPGRWR